MKKLRLQIDALTVESFPTAEKEREVGTVRGFDSTTGNQIICGCTDNTEPCDSQNCGSANCSYGCPGTREVTCATGDQIICQC